MTEYLKAEYIAKEVGKSERWVRRRLFVKKLPVLRMGRDLLVTRADWEGWKRRNTIGGPANINMAPETKEDDIIESGGLVRSRAAVHATLVRDINLQRQRDLERAKKRAAKKTRRAKL